MAQQAEYKTFTDKGVRWKAPDGYKNIWCHITYGDKHDGQHKSQFVAGGHLMDSNNESVYYGVISFCGIRLILSWVN
jgi:hypothetical protein